MCSSGWKEVFVAHPSRLLRQAGPPKPGGRVTQRSESSFALGLARRVCGGGLDHEATRGCVAGACLLSFVRAPSPRSSRPATSHCDMEGNAGEPVAARARDTVSSPRK